MNHSFFFIVHSNFIENLGVFRFRIINESTRIGFYKNRTVKKFRKMLSSEKKLDSTKSCVRKKFGS
jgi:hypothetical protein